MARPKKERELRHSHQIMLRLTDTKYDDLLVAQRQKHNGISWSEYGSSSLAAIEMVFRNG